MNNKRVQIFSSFEEENAAETKRRSSLSQDKRLEEFAALQERAWGSDWTSKPIRRKAAFETLPW